MTKRNYFALFLLLVCILAGCAPQGSAPTPTPPPRETPPAPTATPDPAAERLAAMTLEQKVGQLLVAGIEGTQAGVDAVSAIQSVQVGGIILFGRNVESGSQLTALTNRLRELNGGQIPLFLCVDEEGGRVSRMPPEVDDLPAALDFFRSGGDPYGLGQTLGLLCRSFGFTVDFAPVADVWTNPDNKVIGDRALSTDFAAASAAVPQEVAGMAAMGVIPVVKHFPGHGDTAVDSHVGLPVVDKTVEELRAGELLPFQAAIQGGAPAVMAGHILMTAIDPERPASLSPAVVTGLLREELGFDGLVCTDDLTMAAVSDTWGMGEAAVLAVEAGCDLLLVCHGAENLTAARQALLDAAAEGRITEARLDESVRRILALKERFGLSSDPVPRSDVAALNEHIRAVLP